MRHFLLSCAIAARPRSVLQATAPARLVTALGCALRNAPRFASATLATVNIAAVATRADEYLEPAACAQEQACACTNPTAGEILPPHSCSARCEARR